MEIRSISFYVLIYLFDFLIKFFFIFEWKFVI